MDAETKEFAQALACDGRIQIPQHLLVTLSLLRHQALNHHPSMAIFVDIHSDQEESVRDLNGFVPTHSYDMKIHPYDREIGACERFRFVVKP